MRHSPTTNISTDQEGKKHHNISEYNWCELLSSLFGLWDAWNETHGIAEICGLLDLEPHEQGSDP